jgi:hypothetical protein
VIRPAGKADNAEAIHPTEPSGRAIYRHREEEARRLATSGNCGAVDAWCARLGRLANQHALMEGARQSILSVRLQIGRQQAVVLLQALDHRAHVVANLHDVMVRQRH